MVKYSAYYAEGEGFEPPVPERTTVFKTAALDHSANPLEVIKLKPEPLDRGAKIDKNIIYYTNQAS